MKKLSSLFGAFLVVIVLVGCSNGAKEQTKIKEQEEKIEALTHEKRELELLLENEKQKDVSVSETVESSNSENVSGEELKSLFDSFVRAQFEQDNETLRSVTTAKLYTILVDKAGEKESSVSFQSTVKEFVVFQAEQINDDEAVLIGKVEVETKVGEFSPSCYQQLVECKAIRNSEGQFQVDFQELTNLMQ